MKIRPKITIKNIKKLCNSENCENLASLYDFITNKLCMCMIHKNVDNYYYYGQVCRRWDGKQWRYKCESNSCKIQPAFGDPNANIKKRCVQHKLETDENLCSNKCEEKKCKSFASFGDPIYGIRRRCGKHKLETDEDIKNKKCEKDDCKSRATFGDPVDGIAKRCARHKRETDENVVSKRCEEKGCKTIPTFGNRADGLAKRCTQHKQEIDEDVKNKRCEEKDCKIQPVFGDYIDGLAKRCAQHKRITDEDIRNKRCEKTNCKTQPAFGNLVDGKAKRCAEHKLETDENVRSKKCEFEGCKTVPIFGDLHDCLRKRCLRHKLETDIDVFHKRCQKCQKNRIYFDDICPICDPTLNERVEYKVVNFLLSQPDQRLHDFVHNRQLPNNNDDKKYRPDLLYIYNNPNKNTIIVEVDENQHKGYDPKQEEKRMNDLHNMLGHNTLFIRFNPHQYKVGGKIINLPLNEKLSYLAEKLLYYFDYKIEEPLEIIKLYYDA